MSTPEPRSPGLERETAVDGSPSGRRLLRDTLISAGARGVHVLGWTLVAPTVLGVLGAERFGFWALLTLFSGLVATFDLGLGPGLTRFVAEHRAARDPRRLRGAFTAGMSLYAGAGVLWGALLLLLHEPLLDLLRVPPHIRAECARAMVLAGPTAAVTACWAAIGAVLTGMHELRRLSVVQGVLSAAQVLGSVLLLQTGGDLASLLAWQCATTALAAAVGLTIMMRLDRDLRWDRTAADREQWRGLTRFGLALQLVNLGALATFHLPKLLLARFASLSDVAAYDLGLRAGLAVWSIPLLFAAPLIPALAHLWAVDRDRFEEWFQLSSRVIVTVGTFSAAALIAVAQPLFHLWIGSPQPLAAGTAQALGLMQALNMLAATGCFTARAAGRPWDEVFANVSGTLVLLALGVGLIPRSGLAGAWVAGVVSMLVCSGLFLFRFHRSRGGDLSRWFGRHALRPLGSMLVATVAATLVLHWMGRASDRPAAALRLVASGGTFALVAGSALSLTGAFRTSELVRWWRQTRSGAGPGAGSAT